MQAKSTPRPPARWRPYVLSGVLPLLAGVFVLWVGGSFGGLELARQVVGGREPTGQHLGYDAVSGWFLVVCAALLSAWCCWRAYALVRLLRRPDPRALPWTSGPMSPPVPAARGPRARIIGLALCLVMIGGGLALSWFAGAAVVAAETFGFQTGADVTTTVVHKEFQSRTIGGYRYSGRCQGQRLTFEYRDPDDGRLSSYEEGFCDNDPLSRVDVGTEVPAHTVPGSGELFIDRSPGEHRLLFWPVVLFLLAAGVWCSAQVVWCRALVRRGAPLHVGRATVVSENGRGAVLRLADGQRRAFALEPMRLGLPLEVGGTVRLWASRLDWRGRPAGPWVVDGRGKPLAMSHVTSENVVRTGRA